MKLKPFLQFFGIIAIFLTLLPFVAIDYWWIRIFDFPHTQLTILTFVAFMVYFFRFDLRSWRDYIFAFILGGCFIFQLLKIYPYTPFAEKEVGNNQEIDQNSTLSIIAANVLQDNTETKMLLQEILLQEPDLIVLTEANQRWRQELSPALQNYYPFNVEVPLENTYGMLLYSKYELIDPEIKYLIDDSIPSIHTILKLPSNQNIQLHSIHPTPPMPQHNPSSTDRDAEMMMVAKMAKEAQLPVIVTGDFNDVAWSETTSLFQKVSGLLDPRVGRGFYNTFNANNWLLRWPLDHLFVSEDFRMVELVLGNHIGSDHFPLYAKLSLESQIADEQHSEEPSDNQNKRADKR